MTNPNAHKPHILVVGHGAGQKITRAGGVPVFTSQVDETAWQKVAKAGIHGMLLLGGGDVNPNLYGEDPRAPGVYGVSDCRDATEWYALEEARTRGIPIMGICRGNQIMNVHAGGTLHVDIQSLPHTHKWHQGSDARVVAVKGSRLAKAWGKREQWTIHIHHQAVRDLAPGYVASAFAHDGIIEAVEPVEGWELGVQFHPEMDDTNPAHQRIFNRFVLAAARAAGLPDSQPIQPKATQPAFSYGTGKPAVLEAHAKAASKPKRTSNPVTHAWKCGQCSVRFDKQIDFADHMVYLHGQMREALV